MSKIAAKYIRDLTQEEIDWCIKDTIVFSGDKCVSNAVDFVLKFKGEKRKVKNRIVKQNLQRRPHNGSGFDTRISLIYLPCDKRNIDINKIGKGIIELKFFNGYVQNNKKRNPQYLHFRCGMPHLSCSIKKLAKTVESQEEFLKKK